MVAVLEMIWLAKAFSIDPQNCLAGLYLISTRVPVRVIAIRQNAKGPLSLICGIILI